MSSQIQAIEIPCTLFSESSPSPGMLVTSEITFPYTHCPQLVYDVGSSNMDFRVSEAVLEQRALQALRDACAARNYAIPDNEDDLFDLAAEAIRYGPNEMRSVISDFLQGATKNR